MSSWTEGQRAGLFCIGNLFNGIGILKENGKNYLYLENNGSVEKVKPVSGKKIYFRATMNARTNQHQLYYSTDNKNFTPCGEAYSLRFGDWKVPVSVCTHTTRFVTEEMLSSTGSLTTLTDLVRSQL